MTPFVCLTAPGAALDRCFADFDMKLFRAVGETQCTLLTQIVYILTNLGDPIFCTAVCVLGLGLCFFRSSRKYGVALFVSILLGLLLSNIVLKPLIDRARPYVTLQHIDTFMQWYRNAGSISESDRSFPSGHVVAAFEIALPMFLLFWQDKKRLLACCFPPIALGVAFSRIYLMVHYPSDVLFGGLLGIFCGTAGYLFATRTERPPLNRLPDLTGRLPACLTPGRRKALVIGLMLTIYLLSLVIFITEL